MGRWKESRAIGTGTKAYRAEPFYPRGDFLTSYVVAACVDKRCCHRLKATSAQWAVGCARPERPLSTRDLPIEPRRVRNGAKPEAVDLRRELLLSARKQTQRGYRVRQIVGVSPAPGTWPQTPGPSGLAEEAENFASVVQVVEMMHHFDDPLDASRSERSVGKGNAVPELCFEPVPSYRVRGVARHTVGRTTEHPAISGTDFRLLGAIGRIAPR
jgi:hypothetical protein